MRFKQYNGDLMGLPTNENHLNFRWCEHGCKVLFSMTRKGRAASCHFASDKNGMKKIVQAINEFCQFVFMNFSWCVMILALIKLKVVKSIVKSCGFAWIASDRKQALYIRRKTWVI